MRLAIGSKRPEDDTTAEPPARVVRELKSIVQEHIDFVWRVLRRLGLSPSDAEDATQQVFMVAARKKIEGPPALERSFLYGTAIRIASNVRRARRRHREGDQQPISENLESADPGPDRLAELGQARALLDELLAKLPEELAKVLILVEIEQLTLPEVARLEGLPIGTASSRLRRARFQFRKLLHGVEHRNPFASEKRDAG